ncbi:MAG: hypothetical protein LBV66_01660 [Elusimicrobiota bacterium]|jgi:hypothetical protein|nr:hypothetical protein [Elusimicrobiota bacterium]
MKIKVLSQKILGRFKGLFFIKAVLKGFDYKIGNDVFYRKYNEIGNEVVLPIQRMAGIGNRIKSMAAHLSYYKTKEMFLAWPSSGWVNKSFKDLFDLSQTDYKIKEIDRQIPIIESDFVTQLEEKYGSVLINKSDIISIEMSSYEKISDIVSQHYGHFFSSLKPSSKVLQRINSIKLPSEFLSLYIRNNYDWAKFSRESSLSEFADVLKSNSLPVYLSCMNYETSLAFRKLYNGEIIELADKNYNSTIDAVADLYILSKGKNAVYSYGSTFCELAFYLSGGKQKVSVVGTRKHWIK